MGCNTYWIMLTDLVTLDGTIRLGSNRWLFLF